MRREKKYRDWNPVVNRGKRASEPHREGGDSAHFLTLLRSLAHWPGVRGRHVAAISYRPFFKASNAVSREYTSKKDAQISLYALHIRRERVLR